jgi:hypothetical protein
VWIDVERLQGSTVDAMATAIDGAKVVVYGCSEDYKNSQNCRLEAVRIDCPRVSPFLFRPLLSLCRP